MAAKKSSSRVASRKKSTPEDENPSAPPSADEIEEAVEQGGVSAVKHRVTHTKTYVEAKENDENVHIVDDEEEEAELSPLAKFQSAGGLNSELKLRFQRQPDPPELRGHVAIPCNTVISFSDIPYDPDNFLSDVTSIAGSAGRFRLQLVRQNGQVIYTMTLNIGTNPPQSQSTAVAAAQPAAKPQDDFASRLHNRFMQKMMDKFFDEETEQKNPPPDKQSVIAEFLLSDPNVRELAIKNIVGTATAFAGTDENLSGWQRVFMSAINNPMVLQLLAPLLPMGLSLVTKATSMFSGAAGRPAGQPGAQLPPAQPGLMTAGPPVINPQPPTFQPVESPMEEEELEPLYQILDPLMKKLKFNQPLAEEDAAQLRAHQEKFPNEFATVKNILLNLPPAAVPQLILFATSNDETYAEALAMPHAIQWLTVQLPFLKERV